MLLCCFPLLQAVGKIKEKVPCGLVKVFSCVWVQGHGSSLASLQPWPSCLLAALLYRGFRGCQHAKLILSHACRRWPEEMLFAALLSLWQNTSERNSDGVIEHGEGFLTLSQLAPFLMTHVLIFFFFEPMKAEEHQCFQWKGDKPLFRMIFLIVSVNYCSRNIIKKAVCVIMKLSQKLLPWLQLHVKATL